MLNQTPAIKTTVFFSHFRCDCCSPRCPLHRCTTPHTDTQIAPAAAEYQGQAPSCPFATAVLAILLTCLQAMRAALPQANALPPHPLSLQTASLSLINPPHAPCSDCMNWVIAAALPALLCVKVQVDHQQEPSARPFSITRH